MGSQPASQIGREAAKFGAERRRQRLGNRDVVGPLIPRPTETMRSAWLEIDRLLRLPERRLRAAGESSPGSTVAAHGADGRRRAAPLRGRVGAKRADLKGRQVRRGPSSTTSAVTLP